jgi:hypothetical protein
VSDPEASFRIFGKRINGKRPVFGSGHIERDAGKFFIRLRVVERKQTAVGGGENLPATVFKKPADVVRRRFFADVEGNKFFLAAIFKARVKAVDSRALIAAAA